MKRLTSDRTEITLNAAIFRSRGRSHSIQKPLAWHRGCCYVHDDAKAYIQLRLYKSVIESCATWSTHPHSHTLNKQASRHKNSIPSLLSPRLKQRLIDCAATPAQTDRAAHAGRHLRTDTDTFSNLRQHGLTVVLQGWISLSVTCSLSVSLEATSEGALPCRRKRVRGDCESPAFSWFAITGSSFQRQRGSGLLLFISQHPQGVRGKTSSCIHF